MFEGLSDRFEGIFKRLRGRGRLTEKDIDEVAREIRLALLEADVNVRVVKSFVARVTKTGGAHKVVESTSTGRAGNRAFNTFTTLWQRTKSPIHM